MREMMEIKKPVTNKKKVLTIVLGVVALIVIFVLVKNLRQYHNFAEKDYRQRGDITETNYLDFQGNLLKYSRDGAFCTKYNGDLIWSYTYEMSNPKIDVCDNYILIYDAKGTQAAILSNTGFLKKIKTSMPIVDANISRQGTVVFLMQEDDTGYVQLYDVKGTVLVSGELHMENNGYPVAIDLSKNGQRMMVSQLDLNGGDIKTTIAFYDFGKEGKDKIDNMIANYSFSNQIFPQIEFLDNGKAVAFGDSEIVLFGSDSKCSISKEIFPDGEIKSVFASDSYFGMICNTTGDDGKYFNQLNVYSETGYRRCQKKLKDSYSKIEMLGNKEICLTDGKKAAIYSLMGIRKFAYNFDTGIYKIIAGDSARRYYFITDDKISSVRLK